MWSSRMHNCVGSAVLAGYKCPKCQAGVEKFVGMQTPLPVSRNNDGTYQEGEWSTEETEKLAVTAASSDTIIIIHQLEDRPSPLYSSRAIEQGGDQASPTHHAGRGLLKESNLDFDLLTLEPSGERQSRIKAKRTPGHWFHLRIKMNSLLHKIRSL